MKGQEVSQTPRWQMFGRIFRMYWRLLHSMMHLQLCNMASKSSWQQKMGDKARHSIFTPKTVLVNTMRSMEA